MRPIAKGYSLSTAAALLGVDRHTLKAWLIADFAMEFPEVKRGSKFLIPAHVIELVRRRRAPQSNFARQRVLKRAS